METVIELAFKIAQSQAFIAVLFVLLLWWVFRDFDRRQKEAREDFKSEREASKKERDEAKAIQQANFDSMKALSQECIKTNIQQNELIDRFTESLCDLTEAVKGQAGRREKAYRPKPSLNGSGSHAREKGNHGTI